MGIFYDIWLIYGSGVCVRLINITEIALMLDEEALY